MCRVSDTGPLMIYPPVLMAGVRNPSGKEPRGAGLAVCYLWGFAGAGKPALAEDLLDAVLLHGAQPVVCSRMNRFIRSIAGAA